jgi:carboxymethylenebutenolidase
MPTDSADFGKIQAPVLGNFGGTDRGISPESVGAFEKAMKAANKTIDLKIYEGAGHAFQNPNNKMGYHADDDADSWKRTMAFLDRKLK